MDPIFLTTTVSEKYINQLKFGQKGEVFLKNGYKDVGKINYISATADPQTKKFEVQVELKNSKLLDKMKRIMEDNKGVLEADDVRFLAPRKAD